MIQAYQEALRIWPDNVQCWTSIAMAYKTLGDLEGAVRAYRHALSLRPDDVGLWTELAMEYPSHQGKLARHALWEAEQRRPDAGEWWMIGVTYQFHLDEYELAQRAFEKATQMDPQNSQYLVSLGQVYILRGSFSEARKLCERLKIVDPDAARRLAESLR